MTKTLHLPQMTRGQRGTIEKVCAQNGFSKRLADMGFVRGAEITMIKPGRPCIVAVAGRQIGLGSRGQEHIQVNTIAITSNPT